MARWIRAVFWSILKCLMHGRYRVRITGLEALRELRGPTLVMPNHPALIDPPLVLSHLPVPGGLRPIVTESMYRKPYLYPIMRLVRAIEVPELEEHSRGAREQTFGMIETIAAGLNGGDSFLIYPAGRAERGGVEVLGAARAASEILARCPHVNVVLVRTCGLWGSMFSYAQTGRQPDLVRCTLRGLGWVFASLIFFLPRRDVTLTVEVIDRSKLPELTRDKLNRYLEEWYNRELSPTPIFVPYHHRFGPREFNYPEVSAAAQIDLERIRPATIEAVNEMIAEHRGHPLVEDEQQPDRPLDRIGLDSLERMDLALQIEDRFGFRSDRVAETLGELWALAEGQLSGGNDGPQPAPPGWNQARGGGPAEVLGDTVAEAFVRRALAQPDEMAVADRLSGALTYRRLLVGARLMARQVEQMPGEAIGVLLPASVAADLVFFAIHLAGKLPVLLNWTTGPANLAHAVETLKVRRVITSQKLIDRLGIEIPGIEYAFLEQLRGRIGKVQKFAGLLVTYLMPGQLLRSLPQPDVDKPAVVLFTSGSENTPKAVPLTHRNLIANLRASLPMLEAQRSDVLFGFLPPFHSFGLLGNILAGVLGGLRLVHHPDPTDAAGLVRIARAYNATVMVTTPTFLSYMLNVASGDDFHTLRIIVTGAEKCPETLFSRARAMAPGATILEGYGITECSPVVSGNRLGHVRADTVGQPIEGVEVLVVDPDSHQPLPTGTTGMLLVRGPSIFGGYLNYDGPDPFVEAEGHRWYLTGDLVQLDEDRFIHFRGRLKRFLKVGGEMVSLPALEEPFVQRRPPTEDGPQVAVEGVDGPGGRWIVLFTTLDIPLRQANSVLSEAGFRGVMRLDATERLQSIPVLGTGKTDYKVLRKLAAEKAPK